MKTVQVKLNDVFIPSGKEFGQSRERKVTDVAVLDKAYSIQEKGIQNLFSVSNQNKVINTRCPYEIIDGSGRYFAFLLMSMINDADCDQGPITMEDGRVINGTMAEYVEGTLTHRAITKESLFTVRHEDRIIPIAERLAVQLTANFSHDTHAAKDAIDSLVEIRHNFPEMSNKELAAFIGKSEAHINKLFKTVKLPDHARTALTTGDLSLVNAVTLSKMGKMDDVLFDSFLDYAKKLPAREFNQKVGVHTQNELVRKQKEKDEATGAPKVVKEKVFTPVLKLRTKEEIIEAYKEALTLYTTLQADESTNPAQLAALNSAKAVLDVISYVVGMDPASIEAQKVEYDKGIKLSEEAKGEKKAKREKLGQFAMYYRLIKAGGLELNQIKKDVRAEYAEYAKERQEKEDAAEADKAAADAKAAAAKAAESETAAAAESEAPVGQDKAAE